MTKKNRNTTSIRRCVTLKKSLRLICPLVMLVALLTGCNNSSDYKKSEKQQRVDNLSNKINTKYKKNNGVVEKDGKVHKNGVVNDQESRKMNNK